MAAATASTTFSRDEKTEFLRFIRSMAHDNKAASNTFTFRKELSLSDVQWINDIVDNISGLFNTYMPTLELSHVVEGVNVVVTCVTKTPINKVTNVLENIDCMIGLIEPPSLLTQFPSTPLTLSEVSEKLDRIMEEASEIIERAEQRQQPWWIRILQ